MTATGGKSKRPTDLRALAAQAMAEVALQGASLRDVIERSAPQLTDARDRALLSALLHEGARWWLRFDAALDRLLQQPLRRKEPNVHALLALGLVQIEIMQLPAYAAVAASVEAARALKRPRLAALVNAVLRRWQRERETLLPLLDADPVTRHAQPRWLIDTISHDWPVEAEAILAANNIEPPLTLRVNRRRSSREALLVMLDAAGHPARPHAWLADAVLLERSTDVTRLPGFAEGLFAVQDGAAQAAVECLDIADGQRVLDACAAPGGKACHLLERAAITLTALESDAQRLPRIHANFARLGLSAQVICGDATDPSTWWDGVPFERILIDAPCSATGVLRRRADVRLHRRDSDMATMIATQRRILAAMWPLLAPGGRLLYVTCSLLRAENQASIAALRDAHPEATVVPLSLPCGHPAGDGWQILPGEDDLDGMYFAALHKPLP